MNIDNKFIIEDLKNVVRFLLSDKVNSLNCLWGDKTINKNSLDQLNFHIDNLYYQRKVLAIGVYFKLFDGCTCGCRGDYGFYCADDEIPKDELNMFLKDYKDKTQIFVFADENDKEITINIEQFIDIYKSGLKSIFYQQSKGANLILNKLNNKQICEVKLFTSECEADIYCRDSNRDVVNESFKDIDVYE